MSNILTSNYKEKINDYLISNFGIDMEKANDRQIYEALMTTIKDILAKKKYEYNKKIENHKMAYYMSMEFLVGKTLRNNLFNLGIEDDVREFFKENNTDLDKIYEIEPDPGLGNGGLGRLASCFMDAMTSTDYPMTGFSILYEFGIFKQILSQGWQQESPDTWLELGKFALIPRADENIEVKFYGNIVEHWTDDGLKVKHENYTPVIASPYDLLISGYDTDTVNNLRLWSAKAKLGFDINLFSRGEYAKSSESDIIASSISKVLYPADEDDRGKELRIKQQYFFVSASLQQILKEHYNKFHTFDNFSDYAAIHINDTHPSLCIPEFMRILLDEYDYEWELAWSICVKTFAYTNHTVMAEALEKWSVPLFKNILPRIYMIIEEINARFCYYVQSIGKGSALSNMAIIYNNVIKMANLSIIGSHSVNGVSKLHSDIIKEDTFKDFNEIYKDKFTNVTNGIAHRRWLGQANKALNSYLSELIGDDFLKDLSKIEKLLAYKDDKKVLEELSKIKLENKKILATYIEKTTGIHVDINSIFDVQVKRLHEYKRQLLNALHIVYLYLQVKNKKVKITPRTFIFGAKASSGYMRAKEIIKFIWSISEMIKKDPEVRDFIKVVFIEDYKVSLAEIIIPAADVSEQISQAGKEASGTGNMKFMLNGVITLGTMDGANVEIYEQVGEENIVIFGLRKEEVNELYKKGYNPRDYYEKSEKIKMTLDFISNNSINGEHFNGIVEYLLNYDPYMNLADFESYVEAQEKIEKIYNDKEVFNKISLINTAKAGIFSADRSVNDYSQNIWHLKKCK